MNKKYYLRLIICFFQFFLLSQFISFSHAAVTDIFYIDPLTCPTITMYVRVTNQSGEAIYGLTSSNFLVTEDGVIKTPVTVAPLGVVMALALDYSGSMLEEDNITGISAIDNLKTATKTLINDMQSDDELELIKFASTVTVLQKFTSDQAKLLNAIDSSGNATGATAFFDATYKAVEETVKKKSNNPNKVVIAMTDGQDNSSSKTSAEVINYAKANSVPVYCVGFGGYDEDVMQQIADETGGLAFFTQDSGELAQIFLNILEIIRDEYSVKYQTTFMDYTDHTAAVEVATLSGNGSDSIAFKTCPYGLPLYDLKVTRGGDGFGTLSTSAESISGCASLSWSANIGVCSAYQGFAITLTGAPFPANFWTGWSNATGSAIGCSGLQTACTFNIASNTSLTGSFYKASTTQHTFTLTKAGDGSGTINVAGCSPVWVNNVGTCTVYSGANISVSGLPVAPSTWLGWSDATGSASACSGTSACNFVINTDSQIKGSFDDGQASGGGSINHLLTCNIDNDNKDDVVKTDNNGNIFYSTNLLIWNNISDFSAGLDIACDDLNTDRYDDFVVLDNNGSVWYKLNNGTSWLNIPSITPFTKIFISDINSDGKKDIIALDKTDRIYITYNLATWLSLNGFLSNINTGNYNVSRSGKEIAGINIFGEIFVMNDFNSWIQLTGSLSKIFTGDLNGDGKDDLIGLNSNNQIYYSSNLMNWASIPGSLVDLATGDLNADGKSDVVGINASNSVYYTNNLISWVAIPNVKLIKITLADFNGDGKLDILGVGTDGKLYYSTDLTTWNNF